MIFWVTTGRHSYTIKKFLVSYGKQLVGNICPISYSKLFRSSQREPGTYLFSDLERLSKSATAKAANIWQQLRDIDCRVLNHPVNCLRRYDLLRGLHDRGVNDFNVYRLASGERPAQFPVFLRRENDHRGSRSSLLNNVTEFDKTVAELTMSRFLFRDELGKRRLMRWGSRHARQLLITEFCDSADEGGIYRKYSAFCVGGQIVPRHLFFGLSWMLKAPQFTKHWTIEEERRYVFTNPHERKLEEIFRYANIEYGRIDYGLVDGRIQVWEINTNPMILVPADFVPAENERLDRQPIQQHFAEHYSKAVLELDDSRFLLPLRHHEAAIQRSAAA